ncbi:acyl-CoA thioester hydrolase [Hasllibacter halocynthiae]|uniref:Acyl-CoA thioester hydrolase n=1 Tax=Hasllibacter halocynthiae TaxID=595589 RepID=A0A2T0X9P2_9RHOB|nr:YbgC/FadM family acyl-CoA thioesterase [Hasllibacter halocynthiae]PRY95643.1 acyl-CoA thioester hydrolase [Hasllibacter halocynthiae]
MTAPHLYEGRVHYEDTDMGGVVYHANWLKFCERARSDWVRGLGLDQNALREAGTVFVVRHMECDWIAPARLDDPFLVETVPEAPGRARAVLRQRVSVRGAAAFEARVTIAAMGPTGRPVRLPEALRAAAA